VLQAHSDFGNLPRCAAIPINVVSVVALYRFALGEEARIAFLTLSANASAPVVSTLLSLAIRLAIAALPAVTDEAL